MLADDDVALSAAEAAAFCGCAKETFWRAVTAGRLPPPVYPASRRPIWRKGKLRQALEARRMLPAQAKEARRVAKLARETAARAARLPLNGRERRLRALPEMAPPGGGQPV
jgi:predicted DNA-binding transcriptional regulator AlpA